MAFGGFDSMENTPTVCGSDLPIIMFFVELPNIGKCECFFQRLVFDPKHVFWDGFPDKAPSRLVSACQFLFVHLVQANHRSENQQFLVVSSFANWVASIHQHRCATVS